MKNLFDFATKELSQDAFLRWLFENYEDPEVGPIVIDFINYFSAGQEGGRKQFSLKCGDITYLKTFAQVDNIDVSIDFRTKQDECLKTIVIEDKTDSHEHKQLELYNKAIERWKYNEGGTPEQCVYKVFYKTSKISEDEMKRVKDAKWTAFGINEINTFFQGYKGKVKSDVLNDYIEHIEKISNAYDSVSNEPLSDWGSVNWETFFNEFIKNNYPGLETNFSSYRGIYDDMRIYVELNRNTYLKYIAFQILIRGKLRPYIHPGFRVNGKEKWSPEHFENSGAFDICKQEQEELRAFISKSKSTLIKRSNSKNCFARIETPLDKKGSVDELKQSLKEWLDELLRLIKEYDN